MKTNNFLKVLTVATMLVASNQAANAQFFKKLGKAAEKAAKAVDSATKTVESTTNALEANNLTTDSVSIDWDKIPVFSLQKVYETDASGNKALAEDGTQKYHVWLVDQFGNKRSPESVKAQIKIINDRVLAILTKVGVGAGIGALQNGLSGAAVGAATGAVASLDDIAMAKKQKKSLNQQKKLLEVYQQNFTEEGKPINAKVDTSKLAGLDIKEDNALSMTAEDIKKELESSEFNTTDQSAFDF